jgi:hypothetical protein
VPTPTPIEPIHFDQPRAVQVREPEDVSMIHSAISGRVHIYTETKTEADAILAAWRVIMQAAADKANEILRAVRANPPAEQESVEA